MFLIHSKALPCKISLKHSAGSCCCSNCCSVVVSLLIVVRFSFCLAKFYGCLVCSPCVCQGVREVVLLGQNVNSYRDCSTVNSSSVDLSNSAPELSKGFQTVYRTRHGGKRFADLLEQVAQINRDMRIRFTSPHPKDFPDEV